MLSEDLNSHQQKDFENDFITNKPSHYDYIRKLQQWRQKFEAALDARPRLQPLALLSHYLTEFQYSKIDDIEIPGQYTEVRLVNLAALFIIDRSPG